MRVGIMTFVDYSNYGNRLQNYALQCLLERYGVEVETILNEKYYDYKHVKGNYKARLLNMAKAVFWKLYDCLHHDVHAMGYIMKSDPLKKQRIAGNLIFSEKYIKETKFIIRKGNLHKRDMRKYDYIFAGSDQVWNPTMAGASDMFFLQFVPQYKRVAFSASIGMERIPDAYLAQWKKYIAGMNYITVREESAKQIVEETSDKKAEVLLDPTMLVDGSVWIELMRDSEIKLPTEYMMTYILGKTEETEQIAEFGKAQSLQVVEFNNREYEDIYTLDVVAFLKYIANAELIITDSFHACVFSILFQKEFYVFKREGEYSNIYTRIEGLLKKFGLEDREIESLQDIERSELSIAQRENLNAVLAKEREKADGFLKAILKK